MDSKDKMQIKNKIVCFTMIIIGIILILFGGIAGLGFVLLNVQGNVNNALWPAYVGASSLLSGIWALKQKKINIGILVVYTVALLIFELYFSIYSSLLFSYGSIRPLQLLIPVLAAFTTGPLETIVISFGAAIPSLMSMVYNSMSLQSSHPASYFLVLAVQQFVVTAIFALITSFVCKKRGLFIPLGILCATLDYFMIMIISNILNVRIFLGHTNVVFDLSSKIIIASALIVSVVTIIITYRKQNNQRENL